MNISKLIIVSMLSTASICPALSFGKESVSAHNSYVAGDLPSQIKLDLPAQKFTLKNGLTVIVHEDRTSPLVAVNIWYHVGSKNEPAGRSGFAHLFEHLMFNGSENFNDDWFKATEKLGASEYNGTTSEDRTDYFQTVPTAALDSILWLESDRMGHLLGAIDQAKLDEQRAVVKNEKRSSESDPYSKSQELILRGTMPSDHPYAHGVIGSMDDLDAATLDEVKQWFGDFYGPSNAVIVLAGDISPAEGLEKVNKYFGSIDPGTPVSQPKSRIVRNSGTRRDTAYVRGAQPVFFRVWNISDYASADTGFLQLLARVLTDSRTSPLYRSLVMEKKLATSVEARVANREIAGQFSIKVTGLPGTDLAVIEEAVAEELRKILEKGPPAAELKKAKAQTVIEFARGFERIGGKAAFLAESETFLGSPDAWKLAWERYVSAKPSDLQRSARTWLKDGDYVLYMEPTGALVSEKDTVDRRRMPGPSATVPATFPEIERATLSNGLKIAVVRRVGSSFLDMGLLLNTGHALDWQQDAVGTSGLAMGLLDNGTKTRTADQLSDAISDIGASIFSGGGGEVGTVSMATLKSTLPAALDILADVVMNPSFDEKEVKSLKQTTLAGLKATRADADWTAKRLMPRIMFGDRSPYGRVFMEADAEAVNPEVFRNWHSRWVKPNNATFVIVGDTNLSEMQPMVESAFRHWAPGKVPERIVPQAVPATEDAVYLIDKPGASQSSIIVSAIVARRKDGNEIARQAFTSALGGSFTSRLNMKLREEKGWTYGASAELRGGSGSRNYLINTSVQTDKTNDAMIEIDKILKGIVSDYPITEKELSNAKDNLSLGRVSAWSNNAGLAEAALDEIAADLPQNYYRNYASAVAALTISDVNNAGSDLLKGKPLTWIIVGDLSKIEPAIRSGGYGKVHVIDAEGNSIR